MNARVLSPVSMILAGAAALAVAGTAQEHVPSPREVVTPVVYVSAEPAARGVPFQIAVILNIRPGFHVNAREKSEEYLIATDLKAEVPAGFKIGEVAYPKGELHTFTFSKTPLNVYQGKVTLRVQMTALSTSTVGSQQFPLKLRYQACSTEICLPPVTIDLQATVDIAASRAAIKPAHSEVFTAP
jgi:hypothetical protein